MKKALSLILVIAMLAAAVLSVIPASAAATAEDIDYIDALYFEPSKRPTIDGFISTAEWGSMSFSVEATDCATKDDTTPYNRFLYWRTGDRTDYNSFEYQVWLRWCEDYFYIGVKVYDPDGHSLKNGTTETWNGDAIQARIDKAGANAATEGEDFWVSSDHERPWSSKQVPDFLFGYVEIAGGFSEAWENTNNKGMTSFSKNPLGTALCVVAPAGSSYSTDTSKGITTYEVGIPWTYILNGDTVDGTASGAQITALTYTKYTTGRGGKGNLSGGIGREFGMSLAVLNDGTNPDPVWDSFMSWGSGICEANSKVGGDGARSATGSNAVTLSATTVTQTAGYTTYNCASLLDASFSTKNIDKPGVFYDYLAGDLYKDTPLKYEQLSSLTYDTDPDGDRSVWGSDDYFGHVTDIGGTHKGVLDYVSSHETNYIDTRDGGGTIQYTFPTSYTIEFDIKYEGTEVSSPEYESALYNWFGGANVYAFQCGYFFNDKMFKVVNSNDANEVLASCNYDLKKGNWYNWKFQFDNESCTCRLWIDDLSTTADNADSPWGRMIFNVCWRYFYYSSESVKENGTLLLFRLMNVQPMFDNVKIYNFASLTDIAVPEEHSGGGTGTVTENKTGGGELSLDGVTKKDGKWYIPVSVKEEYLTSTALTFALDYDPAKSQFEGIEGLAEGTYTLTESEGHIALIINDFTAVKALKAGDKYFDIVLKAIDDKADVKDLGLKLTDSYTYTVTTGDGMVWIVLAAAVSILGGALIVTKRRRIAE